MALAFQLGLHRIDSLEVVGRPPSVLAISARQSEICDRISTFWHAFVIDRGGSIGIARPVALPDEVRTLPVNHLLQLLNHSSRPRLDDIDRLPR
jgi:hypothetical protein